MYDVEIPLLDLDQLPVTDNLKPEMVDKVAQTDSLIKRDPEYEAEWG